MEVSAHLFHKLVQSLLVSVSAVSKRDERILALHTATIALVRLGDAEDYHRDRVLCFTI